VGLSLGLVLEVGVRGFVSEGVVLGAAALLGMERQGFAGCDAFSVGYWVGGASGVRG
jgi:hypothetical protein